MKLRSLHPFAVVAFCVAVAGGVQAGEPELGAVAPDFTLKGADGKESTLSAFRDSLVVLEWYNPDCPFVRNHYDSGNMQKLQKRYTEKKVIWLIVNSSAEGKQGHCPPERASRLIKEKNMAASAFLLDHDGKVGRLFGARTTPHMFVIGKDGVLLYHGAIDDKPSTNPEDLETAKNYVQAALDEAMIGKPVTVGVSQPYGCSVKYASK